MQVTLLPLDNPTPEPQQTYFCVKENDEKPRHRDRDYMRIF